MEDSYDLAEFTKCALEYVDTRAKRILCFLYFFSKYGGGNAALKDLKFAYASAGLGNIRSDFVRATLKKDTRVRLVRKDTWMIPTDRLRLIEIELALSDCDAAKLARPEAAKSLTQKQTPDHNSIYIDPERINQLKVVKSNDFDLSRLVRICEEINFNYANKNYISTILLVRTVLDHVAPIFGYQTFTKVANNFKTAKSIKETFNHLQNSSRKIADGHLHTTIQKKEVLPTKTQVNFSQDMDVLLGEIVRILW
ncbi:MAG: hypothetical protein AAB618_00315 [Patescibacteria group bacterium]